MLARVTDAIAASREKYLSGEFPGIAEATAETLRCTADEARDELHNLAHISIDNVTAAAAGEQFEACHLASYALGVGLQLGYHLGQSDALERHVDAGSAS